MVFDIVLSCDIDDNFIARAMELGYSGLVFFPPLGEKNKKLMPQTTVIKVESGLLVNDSKLAQSKRMQNLFIVQKAEGNFIPDSYVDLYIGAESSLKGDFIHHRNSGLNQVVCKDLVSQKCALGIQWNVLWEKRPAKALGRMMQNVRFCRKFGIPMVPVSLARNRWELRPVNDVISFLRVIGMSSEQIKEGMEWTEKRVEWNKVRISSDYDGYGVFVLNEKTKRFVS